MDLEGLSSICTDLGFIVEGENGNRIGYTKREFCLDNLNDLRRFLRRDDPQTRDVFKQLCKWDTVSKHLVPIIEHYQEDRNLVIAALKILVYLTLSIEPGSSDIPDQIDYLWGLKAALSRSVTIAVIVSLLEDPLENLERDAFTEDDFKLVQLVLTLFRNILAIQDISMQHRASGSATQFLPLRDRFLELLFQENVADLILVLTQYVGGSCSYLREANLLLLEIFHYIFLGQDPELIAKPSKRGSESYYLSESSVSTVLVLKNHLLFGSLSWLWESKQCFSPKVKKDVKASLNSLSSSMEEEKDKRRLSRIRNLDRHSQFRGSFTRLAMDGSKTLFKGNPGTASGDSLLKPHEVQRGPVKKIACDSGRLSSSNETILKLLHDFMKQFVSAGYNVLMQSIREDIEKEHDAFQNNDIVVFFQLSQFVTAFQHHTFLISKSKMGTATSEAFVNKVADGTFFQGDICGPIAATMNEAMFLLVISKWRYAFEGLKETNDYKFLSVAGSLMKNMIRMLDLVLKLLPEDSKEPQTARILLYKIFYDQTDQGMTQFLVNLIKAFDTHKQPKSDLADLIEMIHIVVRLMENLEARGTLRVSKKSRKGRKKKVLGDMKGTENERLGEDQVNVNGDVGNSTCEPSVDLSMPPRELSENPSSDGKEKTVLIPNQVEEFEIPSKDNTVDEPVQKNNNKEFSHDLDDIECEMGDSSEDDQLVATHEVDFKVSSLVSTFANNIIIQNLCWLLKFYKSNSATTNHYILTMLRRICDDLELSPMLYQLSLLTTFCGILAEQKSSPRKEYANIVSFLTNLVRKMMKKMKNQPLLFVEILFWKTRRECHYISSESLLNELGNLRKESRNWGNVSSGNEGEMDSSQGKGGIRRRSIADALGEDENDLVVSHGPSYQKHPYDAKLQKVTQRDEDSFTEGNRNMTSKSTSEMDGIENLESDDAHNEGHSLEHKTQKVSNRRKRLVFNPELETDIKDLYEKYKDERHCNRLIAEALDPSGGVSPAQVSTKLKQLGLKIASKKRTLHVGGISSKVDGQIESEVVENDSIVHSLKELDESSLLKRPSHSRKRVRAFSKEQEVMVKELYEQFKHHKKCSHMIANALDADNTFTAAQVSRKIKQLGLMKEKTEAKKPLIDEDSDGLIADGEDESDKETLLALKERRKNNKKNKIFGEDVTATGFPKQKIERKSLEDDSDDEVLLSSILGRTCKKQSKERHGKLKTSTVETSIFEASRDQITRDEHSPSNEPGLSHKDTEHDDLIELDSVGKADQVDSINGIKQTDILMNDVNHVSPEVMLEDSGDDDMVPIASTNVVSRRKLKMVIDMDDDE